MAGAGRLEPIGPSGCTPGMRMLAIVVTGVLLAGCSGESTGGSPADPPSSPTVGGAPPSSPGQLSARGCPVAEPDLCTAVAAAANALVDGDVAALLEHSWAEEVRCDEVPADLFPDCAPGRVLNGYGRTGADAEIRILELADFRAELAGLLERIEPGHRTTGALARCRSLG